MRNTVITKKYIIMSFRHLILHKSLAEITVNDILEFCDISRSTFYRYFTDKYDVMIWSYKFDIDQIMDHNSWINTISNAFHFIYENRDFLRNIIDYRGQNSFEDFLIEYTYANTKAIIELGTGGVISKELDYANKIYTYGVCYATIDWIRRRCPETSQEFTKIISDNISDQLKPYLLK